MEEKTLIHRFEQVERRCRAQRLLCESCCSLRKLFWITI